MRVYALAKELSLTSKELLSRLKEMGIEVASHSSSLSEEEEARVREVISGPPPGEEKAEEIPAPPAEEPVREAEEPAAPPPPAEPAASLEVVVVKFPVTVRQLAEYIGRKPNILIKKLLEMGVFASLNQFLDEETAVILGSEYGREIVPFVPEKTETSGSPEREKPPVRPAPPAGANLRPRNPVVTLMGHIDHGKTSILDQIRKSRVTAGEAGGITQHIGAYRVAAEKGTITFLDTPGHAAFTTMRVRGANLTDIVILVVAADEGVMPQTEEAINHARAAGVPIVVALNKIDKSTARPDRVRRQLAERGLNPEMMGGDTIVVEVSAVAGTGLDQLLEMLLLQAEIMELKADPDGPAAGVVIEAKLTSDRGPVATVLVTQGTLKRGDSLVCGPFSAKVKAIFDENGRGVTDAGPSTPVEIMGLSGVPGAGESFQVVENEARAREISELRQNEDQEKSWDDSRRVRLEDIFQQFADDQVRELTLLLKGDVQGSVEAVEMALREIPGGNAGIKLQIIHSGVGAVNESDVMLAAASGAVIIGFQVPLAPKVARLAEAEGVDIRRYRVIYQVVDDIRKALEGLLEPEIKEVILGEARVKEIFKITGLGTVAGSMVEKGKIQRRGRVRVMRGVEEVASDVVTSLKRFKETVEEVTAGKDCGISLANFKDFEVDDILVAYEVEKIAQKL
ncbi:MAG: translation initiation factor IF-2 [Candidatus Erginobacter occultus]|nr:translation initiation factor IF-2 [Candidatus Erginobacter occultus]